MDQRTQNGFTIVEIAIVLVIVGLLIGGVLKGMEMISNAKLKRIESDHAGISAAMFAYQDRYRQLPGDDNNAATRFSVYSPGGFPDLNVNGNGDGVIGSGNDWNSINGATINASSVETELFFAHLRAAGLITGAGYSTAHPTNAFGGLVGVQNGSLRIAGHTTVFGQIGGPIVKILEARLDDGNPARGRIQADTVTNSMDAGLESSVTTYSDSVRYNIAFYL